MGGVLSVNKGSVNPPTFNIISYLPKNDIKPIVLVGKGVCMTRGSKFKANTKLNGFNEK